ncbi:MAG: hypothetical protein M1837_007444 [Sclerophora amabilis]|nr:MAG: hypothetical protein M1837_007444 [Sclerophora amabilis]
MDRRSSSRSPPGTSLKIKYLTVYNFVSAALWLIILGRVVLLLPLVGHAHVYGGVGEFAKWTQTGAVLEILHSLFGLVRSPVSTTAMQVASRLLLVWGIVDQFPKETATSPAYSSMLLAWSFTEVVRYGYFVGILRGKVPQFLTWLRYNTFYILYPLGIFSEVWLIYHAIGPASKKKGIEWEWGLKGILLTYVPGAYILFTHMMGQRRRVTKGKQREGTTTT